jgi:hypothetical protein
MFFNKLGKEAHIACSKAIRGLKQDSPWLSTPEEEFPYLVVDIVKLSEMNIRR